MRLLFKLSIILFIAVNTFAQNNGSYLLNNLLTGNTQQDRDHNALEFNKALDNVCVNGGKIIFPAGSFYFSPVNIINCSKIEITGHLTKLIFYPDNNLTETSFFVFDNVSNCKINNIEIENKGSQSVLINGYYQAVTNLSATSSSIKIINSKEVKIEDCVIINGANAILVENLTELNNNIYLTNNILKNQASYSLYLKNAQSCIIKENIMENSARDGLKTSKTNSLTITNNIARFCGRDGFDFYDGLVSSIVSNNQAISNRFQGFDIKGTPEGNNYLVKDVIVSSNLARHNGYNGFILTSIRYITLSSNISIYNNGNGIFLNTVQNFNLNGNMVSKNNFNGILFDSVSRGLVNNNSTIDNNFNNTQTNSAGFHLINNSDAIVFNGNMAFNGTTIEKGNQQYGMYFDLSCAGNLIIANNFASNKIEEFGGNKEEQVYNFKHN